MYKLIEQEKEFIKAVNKLVNEYIRNLPEKYCEFSQLNSGNRFRPLLVYYGYTLNSMEMKEDLLKISYSIELIHKASTIIDDIIDNDDKRRELDTCHIQYSVNEAIILSIHMLGEAITNIYAEININTIIGTTIKNMCVGTLNELNMTKNTSVYEIKAIINAQTTSIIRNCLLVGFSLSAINHDLYDIEILGNKLGYLFQVLNDCESIFNSEFINKYKGNKNFDYNKLRKNICFTYLKTHCKKKEFITLSSLSHIELQNLFDKYKIKDSVAEEIFFIKKDIDDIINKLSINYDTKRLKEFINYTVKLAEERANISLK